MLTKIFKTKKIIFGSIVLIVILLIANLWIKKPFIIGKTLGEQNIKLAYKATILQNHIKSELDKEVFLIEKENSNLPNLSARNDIFIDLDSKKSIFQKDPEQIVPIASLTKVMTAIIAVEHYKLNGEIVISNRASEVGENSMGLTNGEVYTLNELLYGLVLNSGNDSAVAIAEGVAGSEENFVSWMNEKAKELGLKNTFFADSSGLSPKNVSTSYDLALLSSYALKYPELTTIFSTYEYEIPYNAKHKYLFLQNQTNLLTTYPGVKGIKTGYTEEAGLCLITYAENNGKKILGIILGSLDRRGDAIIGLNYSFSNLGVFINYKI